METFLWYFPWAYEGWGSTKEIWPLRGFFTVSLLLVDLHLDKILLFLRYTSRMSKVYQEFRTEIMETKVVEINAPLINGMEINIHKN